MHYHVLSRTVRYCHAPKYPTPKCTPGTPAACVYAHGFITSLTHPSLNHASLNHAWPNRGCVSVCVALSVGAMRHVERVQRLMQHCMGCMGQGWGGVGGPRSSVRGREIHACMGEVAVQGHVALHADAQCSGSTGQGAAASEACTGTCMHAWGMQGAYGHERAGLGTCYVHGTHMRRCMHAMHDKIFAPSLDHHCTCSLHAPARCTHCRSTGVETKASLTLSQNANRRAVSELQ